MTTNFFLYITLRTLSKNSAGQLSRQLRFHIYDMIQLKQSNQYSRLLLKQVQPEIEK